MSFKLGQLIEHNEQITWLKFKRKYFFLVIALCKFGQKNFISQKLLQIGASNLDS